MKARIIRGAMAVLLALFSGMSLAEAQTAGSVYTMTNSPDGNEVVAFTRDGQGMLDAYDVIPTGGLGSGGELNPLGSQGSLVISPDQRWLLAVNAGSDDVSVLDIDHGDLTLLSTTSSGGDFPVSVTIDRNRVYVLNAGESPNISGYLLSSDGDLVPLTGSTRELGSGAFAQVGFNPRGTSLVVTDKENVEILVFAVDNDGLPAMIPMVSPSFGLVPFGFIFDLQGHLIVSEAGSGSASSYEIMGDGSLEEIDAMVPTGQAATCWIAGGRHYAYTANTGSNTLSAYGVQAGSGNLTLLEAVAGTGDLPLDLDTSRDGRFLYVLNGGDGTIGMFRVNADGSLSDLGRAFTGELEIFAQGLAAR